MKCLGLFLLSCLMLTNARGQQSAVVGVAKPTGIEAKIQPKPGAWVTLKVVKNAPTPNDAKSFGDALPIGNGRLGAKVLAGRQRR